MIGLGYIGLPTSVVLAKAGYVVVGVDVSASVVETINSGRAHIAEPDLDGLLHHVVGTGQLRAATAPEEADVFVLAVPTPFRDEHEPDLSFVQAAARSIAPYVRPDDLIILESTVPPGTTEEMVDWILQERPDLAASGGRRCRFLVAHCPERVLPGRILVELVENDRIVGGIDDESTARARHFYEGFVRGECVATTARTAELAKLSENAFRDVNIAFANELSMIAGRLGVDPWDLIALANRHPRVQILQPGPGVGGHCIAVDPWFIVEAAPDDASLIREARRTNLRKTDWAVQRIAERYEAGGGRGPLVCLGLTYKPDVDDLRESPAVTVTRELAKRFPGSVYAVDPHIDQVPRELAELDVDLLSLDEAVEVAELAPLLVAHSTFRDAADQFGPSRSMRIATFG